MNRAEKAAVIEGLKDKLGRASIAIVTDYKGMDAEEMTKLRDALAESGVDYAVVKNTLVRIAMSGTEHEVLADSIKDTNAIAFGYEDPVAAAKVISKFAKDSKVFEVKSASLEGKAMDTEGLKALSKLPSKEELLSSMLGTMNAVPTGFVSLLANVPRGLLNCLVAIKDQKEAA